MSDWIHFIGKAYYPTPEAFAVEADRYGVTRRIAKAVLKKMSFGDVVHCAMKDNKGKARVFGSFTFDTISGLSRAAMINLITDHLAKIELPDVDDLPDLEEVVRGCGEYLAATPIEIDMTPADLVDALDGIADIGKLMVGGKFLWHDNPGMLRDVKQRQGFRLFDARAFTFARDRLQENGLTPDVSGMFYAKATDPGPAGGKAQAVHKYRRQEQVDRDNRDEARAVELSRQGAFDFGPDNA